MLLHISESSESAIWIITLQSHHSWELLSRVHCQMAVQAYVRMLNRGFFRGCLRNSQHLRDGMELWLKVFQGCRTISSTMMMRTSSLVQRILYLLRKRWFLNHKTKIPWLMTDHQKNYNTLTCLKDLQRVNALWTIGEAPSTVEGSFCQLLISTKMTLSVLLRYSGPWTIDCRFRWYTKEILAKALRMS